jgi:hypothetical protein
VRYRVVPVLLLAVLVSPLLLLAGPSESEDPAPSPSPLRRLPRELRGAVYSPPMSDREEPGSEEEAEARLRELLPALERASAQHERYALRFTCDETIRRSNYSWRTREASSESARRYAYLLVFNDDRSRYQVLRRRLGRDGLPEKGERSVDLPMPDAYAWTFLFSKRNQRTYHYRYLGREIKDFRLTHVIEFDSAVPYVEGSDMREWSGTVWIEDKTFNFVRIEALPSFQERRMSGQWRVYTESFNLPWGKSKPRPRGYEVVVEFNYTRDNLLFPTRVDLRKFVRVSRNRDITDSRLVLEYTDYRFFETGVEQIIPEQPGMPPGS